MVRKKFLFITLVIAALLGGATFIGGAVWADQYTSQIQQLEQQNAAKQAQSNSLALTAANYQQAVDQLSQRIDSIQQEINGIQNKIDSLHRQIKTAQSEINKEKVVLGDNIRTMYLEGDISTLEILASSKNLSDFVNRQEYRNSVANKLKQTLDTIDALKAKLTDEQNQQKQLLKDQENQQNQLQSQENQQAHLLDMTVAQKTAYDNQIASNNSKIATLRAEEAAALAALSNNGGSSPVGSSIVFHNLSAPQNCGGGYDYCYASLDQWVPDNWGLHLARECVHYVANALVNRGYKIPYNLFAGRGFAYQWVGTATSAGAAYVDSSPHVGDVVYFPIGSLGHVGIIDAINSDGSLHVSQMNWYPGLYNTMDVTVTSNLTFLHFYK